MSDPRNDAGNTWGRFVREARQAKGWTIDDLAEAAGVSRMTIIRWENAQTTSFKPDNVDQVAAALGVPLEAARAAAFRSDGVDLPAPLHPLAVTLDRLMAPDSLLTDQEREALEFLAESVLRRFEEEVRLRRRKR